MLSHLSGRCLLHFPGSYFSSSKNLLYTYHSKALLQLYFCFLPCYMQTFFEPDFKTLIMLNSPFLFFCSEKTGRRDRSFLAESLTSDHTQNLLANKQYSTPILTNVPRAKTRGRGHAPNIAKSMTSCCLACAVARHKIKANLRLLQIILTARF